MWRVTTSLLIGVLICIGVWNLYRGFECREYSYVNPDFSCGQRNIVDKAAYTALRNDIIDFIDEKQRRGDATTVSFYFRDLRWGPIFGVNEAEDFAPASLLKLPLVVTYFALEEDMQGFLDTKLVYERARAEQELGLVQVQPSKAELEEGESYSIRDLAYNSLVYSDNAAYFLPVEYLNEQIPEGKQKIFDSFQELGIIDPRDVNEQTVSVRGYASLFRQLYNASYLSSDKSEIILGWLSEGIYDDGIVAGVPKGIVVANKYGERQSRDGMKQLHDCGIVYYPENPYLLCIMMQGDDWTKLKQITSTLSKMVWDEFDSRRL